MRSRPGALKSSLQSSILEDLHVGRDQSLIIVRVVKNISQALRLLSEEVIQFNSIETTGINPTTCSIIHVLARQIFVKIFDPSVLDHA